ERLLSTVRLRAPLVQQRFDFGHRAELQSEAPELPRVLQACPRKPTSFANRAVEGTSIVAPMETAGLKCVVVLLLGRERAPDREGAFRPVEPDQRSLGSIKRRSKANGTGLPIASCAKSGCAGLMRTLVSVLERTEGTSSASDEPLCNQESPTERAAPLSGTSSQPAGSAPRRVATRASGMVASTRTNRGAIAGLR